jgi:hypothetical protein
MAKRPKPLRMTPEERAKKVDVSWRITVHVRALRERLKAANTETEREALRLEIRQWARAREDTGIREPTVIPVPQSYLDARLKTRKAAAAVAGRSAQGIRFVQGGAPGSGKRK